MSTSNAGGAKPTGQGAAASGVDWSTVKPVSVGSEDTMDPEDVSTAWGKIYAAAGVPTADENVKRSIRCAVYVYCTLNGTSRVGDYAAKIKSSSGHQFEAAILARSVPGKIRRFMRGNADEAYDFFKASKVMEGYPDFIAKVSLLGVTPDNAFATADWMGNCSKLTPTERKAANKAFSVGLTRARNSRGGKTLEGVERTTLDEVVSAQGGETTSGPVPWE